MTAFANTPRPAEGRNYIFKKKKKNRLRHPFFYYHWAQEPNRQTVQIRNQNQPSRFLIQFVLTISISMFHPSGGAWYNYD